VSIPWLPLATTCGDVERENGALHVPDPPRRTVAEAQETMTADAGTQGQLVKADELACTVRLQLPWAKSRFCQLTVAPELPETEGLEDGFVALKLIVAGLTVTVKLAWGAGASGASAIGRAGAAVVCAAGPCMAGVCIPGGLGTAGNTAAANSAVMGSQTIMAF